MMMIRKQLAGNPKAKMAACIEWPRAQGKGGLRWREDDICVVKDMGVNK